MDTRIVYLYNRDKGLCNICKQSIDAEMAKLATHIWQKKLGTKQTVKRKDVDISIDHILPKQLFGQTPNLKHIGNLPANTQITHKQCNNDKGNKYGIREWFTFLKNLFK